MTNNRETQMGTSADERLQEIAESLSMGKQPERVTTRDFVRWFGAKRRRRRAVETIRAALKKHGLVTAPDIQQAYFYGEISFSLQQSDNDRSPDDELRTPPIGDDPTHRISKLDAANNEPICINPDARLLAQSHS